MVNQRINKPFFAANIRFLRRAVGLCERGSGLSQKEFAEELDVTRRTVISWESGNIPPKTKLARMGKYFSEKLNAQISPENIVNEDLTGRLEYIPFGGIDTDMTPEQRKILRSIFLSARGLSRDDLDKVADYIDQLSDNVD